MRYKTFDNPHSHDTEWYLNRESADHINENGHRPRLLKVQEYLLELVKNNVEYTICDFGCGNGGLMREIESKISNEIWGYDLCPANVKDANKKGSNNVFYKDFITDSNIRYSDIVICTEVLEHLVNPDDFIIKLLKNGVKYIIASSPNYETPTNHAPYHLWVFNGDSYKDMFFNAGWNVTLHNKDVFQYIIANNL
jgi:2-polyprenyl-3-methyl-5-hydroxy-6-metoxy-1,4-benzoquinol methylase